MTGETSTWHVNQEEVVTYGPEDAVPTAWDVVGTHLGAADVPLRLLDRLRLPIGRATDVDTSPVTGTFWSGEEGARTCISAMQDIFVDAKYPGLDAMFPGMVDVEHGSAAKAGRLDGMPSGAWCWPAGYLEARWPGAPASPATTEEQWYQAMRAWLRICDRSSTAESRAHAQLYVDRFGTYDVTKHKGWPSFDGGARRSSIYAHARVARALRTGETTIDGVKARAARTLRLPACVIQFNRRQPGRKTVDFWQYAADLDGPQRVFGVTNRLPKIRDVWAFPNWAALCVRRSTGRLFARLKASPWHSVTTPDVARVVMAAARARVGQPWLALDYGGYDKTICTAALRAATRVLLEHTDPLDRLCVAQIMHEALTIPILSQAHKPGAGGYLYWRDRANISGVPFTTTFANLINGAASVMAMAAAARISLREAETSFGSKWARVLAGDDTLNRSIVGVSEERLVEAFADLGLVVTKAEGVNFLARQYNEKTGASIPSLSSHARNTLFKEEKSRTDDIDVIRIGIWATKRSLTDTTHGPGHPYASRYDVLIRRVAPSDVAEALTWSEGEAQRAGARLTARALSPKAVQALIDLDAATGALGGDADSGDGDDGLSGALVAAARAARKRTWDIAETEMNSTLHFPTWEAAVDHLLEIGAEKW